MLGQEHQEQYGSHFYQRYHIFGCVMYRSNQSLNIPPPPPRANPGHLTSFPTWEGGNLIYLVFPGTGI